MRDGEALTGKRSCSSARILPYDCSLSPAPSSPQSRTMFFSTYLRTHSRTVMRSLQDTESMVLLASQGC